MGNPIFYVAKVVGYLTIIVILYGIMFSDITNELYWNAINNVSNENFSMYTLEQGELRQRSHTLLLERANGQTYSATD